MIKRKEKEKEKERRSKKWTGPAHQAAHVPLPLLAWLIPMGIASSAAAHSPPLDPLRSSLRSTSLCGSASVRGSSPLSGCAALLPSLAAPLPDLQPLRSLSRSSSRWRGEGRIESTAPRRQRNREDPHQNRRGDGRIEGASACA